MSRLLLAIFILTAGLLVATSASAQPAGGERPGRAPGGEQVPPRRDGQDLAERLDKFLDDDLRWLRDNGLGEFADRVSEIRRTERPGKYVMLWHIHRRVEQLRRLRGEDARLAVEEIRLGFDVFRLALAYRAAPEDQKPAFKDKLREVLQKQFDARLATQRAVMEGIRKRLEQVRDTLQKQSELRGYLVEQRLKTLGDASVPLPEPGLSEWPDAAPEGPRPGRVEGTGLELPAPPDRGSASDAAREPPPAPADAAPAEPEPPAEEPAPAGPQRHRRWAGDLDAAVNRDIAWLRGRGLPELADRMVEIRDSATPASPATADKRVQLWRIHRRVEQLRSLAGEQLRRAIEDIRLGFAIVKLAREFRQADAAQQAEMSAKLKGLLERQFDARLDAQRAIMQAIGRRLEKLQGNLREQQEPRVRSQMLERLLDTLTDPSKPLREPDLVPGLGSQEDD